MDKEKFKNIILENEDVLMEKVIKYGKERNYTKYTATLKEAWRLSIAGLSRALIKVIENNNDIPEMGPDDDFTKSDVAEFGIIEAQKHRSRGVTLGMFLSFMKYYQQAYEDLIYESIFSSEEKRYCSLYIKRYFDQVELGFALEWSGLSEKQKLEELQKSNIDMTNDKIKYLTVFESIYDPIILVDQNNKIENINYKAAQIFFDNVVSGMKYYGNSDTEIEWDWLNSELNKFIDLNEKEVIIEKTVETKKGQKTFMIKFEKMLDVGEKYSGTVILFNDITERKEVEQTLKKQQEKLESLNKALEASNQELESFAYSVSHDLRAPLRHISGFIEMLNTSLPKPIDEKSQHYLQVILDAAKDMGNLIDGLLSFSRIGRTELVKRRINPEEIIKQVIDTFKLETEGRIITWEIEKLPYLEGDSIMLQMVFTNLISNAIKFTRLKETANITIGSAPDPEKDDQIMFYIKDNGVGFDMRYQEKLFGVFQRLHTQKDFEGIGIGLANVKHIVQRHGGRVWAESELNKGATFYFTLPKYKEG